MATLEPSQIEEKKQKKQFLVNKDNNDDNDNIRWKNFFIYVLISLIVSLLIGIIGSNFIFLTYLSPQNREEWIPTKSIDEEFGGFYKPTRGGNSAPSCMKSKSLSFNPPGIDSNWPYSMYKNEFIPGFIQSFKNWIAKLTASSFIIHRSLLNQWLHFTKGLNDSLKMVLLAPLTLLFFPTVFIVGFFITIYTVFEANLLWGLAGFFLLFMWPIVNTIASIQTVKYIILLTITPLYRNFNDIKRIFNCNLNTVYLLFGFFVCISSFLTLDITTSIIATVIYAFTTIISFL